MEAYDRMAPIYDEFNAANDYEVWLGEVLLPELGKHGLRHPAAGLSMSRVLDVGCGTGRAFTPLLARGWQVFGCDVSAEMLSQARSKFGATTVHLSEIDARALRLLSVKPFDLILALNDVVNYLTEDGDLELFFGGVKKNLAPHGLVCFDANSLVLFESSYVIGATGEDTSAAPLQDRGWNWRGLTTDPQPGGIFEAELSGEGIEPAVHRGRHWTQGQVEEAMRACGLRCLAVLGQREDGGRILLEDPPDDDRHYKTIYIGGNGG